MNPWLLALLVILVGGYLLHGLIEILNLRYLREEVPDEFRDVIDSERYKLSQRYLREKTRFGFLQGTVDLAILLVAIFTGFFGGLVGEVQVLHTNTIVQGLIFFGALMGISGVLHLPAAIYGTFVLEARYGFNRTTWKTFVLDRLKGILLGLLLGGPLLALILWFFESTEWAWLYGWGALTGFQLIMMVLGPVLILPLFLRCEPLEEGELKERVLAYAKAQDFALAGISVADGSRRSSKANAFFTGLGRTRRIVLLDTLIEKHELPELLAVLAHEMGHFKRRHIRRLMGVQWLATALLFFLLGSLIQIPGLYAAFGVDGLPLYAGLFFAGILFSPLESLLSFGAHALSRRYEYEADAYAANTLDNGAEGLIRGLKRLSVDSLSNLTPHPLKVALTYSHPPVLARVEALRKLQSREKSSAS